MSLPMTRRGRAIVTRGSLAVRSARASAASRGPGGIAPPRYSPRAETQSKVVAVPRSITTAGVPKSFAPRRRSKCDPADLSGVAYAQFDQGRPGRNGQGGDPEGLADGLDQGSIERRHHAAIDGGRDLWPSMAGPFLSPRARLSAEAEGLVGRRQDPTSSHPSKMPTLMLVLPTSRARSIYLEAAASSLTATADF